MTRRRSAFLFATAFVACAAPALSAQSMRTVVSSRERTNESQLDVSVDFAAGKFSLRPQAGRALYTQRLTYDEDKFEPRNEYERESHSLALGLSTRGHTNVSYHGKTPQVLDLALTPYIPMRLNLKFGAVTADIELGGLAIASASIESGASDSRISFTAPNRMRCEELSMRTGAATFAASGLGNARCERIELKGGVGALTLDFGGAWDADIDTHASIEMGLGQLTLRVPHELGVAIHIEKFLASVDAADFVKRGSTYYSRNYESAGKKLEIDVNAALGDIKVEWINR